MCKLKDYLNKKQKKEMERVYGANFKDKDIPSYWKKKLKEKKSNWEDKRFADEAKKDKERFLHWPSSR